MSIFLELTERSNIDSKCPTSGQLPQNGGDSTPTPARRVPHNRGAQNSQDHPSDV